MKTAQEMVMKINAARILAAHAAIDVIGMNADRVVVLDYDDHRWYVVATIVFKAGSEFFGVRGPVSLKSESMGFNDVGMACEAFEMVEVPSVTYKRKETTP